MSPKKLLLFLLFFSCSNITNYYYTIESDSVKNIATRLLISIDYLSLNKIKVTVQSFPVSEYEIESFHLVFDMKFREDYQDDFTGICIGPSWEKYGPGEFSIILEKKYNYKSSIVGEINLKEDDRCENYFYYLRSFDIQTIKGEIYFIGVATDYTKDYPDAPYIWKQNKLNQIEEIGNSNIEKYSLNFELSK